MSITSDELNYLVWRYLQETGHEVTAFALQDETKVHELDERYNSRIEIGCLVDLVQKGILYSDDENLVNDKGELKTKEEIDKSFSLSSVLQKNRESLVFTGRYALESDQQTDSIPAKQNHIIEKQQEKPIEAEQFIKVLEKSYSFGPSLCNSWNPVAAPVLAIGEGSSTAKIVVLPIDKSGTPQIVDLIHPKGLVELSIDSDTPTGEITAVSWAPKGHYILTCVENGEMRLWTADGKIRNAMALHHSPVICVQWSPDCTYILSQDTENNTIIWDATTGNAVHSIDIGFLKSLSTANIGSDRKNVVLGTDATWIDNTKFATAGINGAILVFQVGERTPIGYLHGHVAAIGALSYSDKYQLMASGSDDCSVRIWKGNSSSSTQVLLGHSQAIVSATWLELYSPDVALVLTSSLDGSVRVWDVLTSKLVLASFLDGVPIYETGISPDQRWLAVGSEEGLVFIYDVSPAALKQQIDAAKISIAGSAKADNVGKLKIVAQYQPETSTVPQDYITGITWSCESNKICISYKLLETVIIDW